MMLGWLVLRLQAAGWKAGVARVDTTPTDTGPDGGLWIADVAVARRGAPARRQGTCPGRRAGHRVVLVTCDIIGFRRPFTNRVAERVKAKHGLPREDLVLFASHNHAGPALVEPAEPAGASAVARGLREQRRLHARAGGQDRRPGRRGARQDGAGQPVLRRRPRPLRPEPPRADRQGDQARQEPRRARPTRACRSSASRTPTASRWRSSSATPATTPRSGPT